jgi:hypothetical protein
MWAVLKYDKKLLNILKIELTKKLGKKCRFYQPKIKYNKYFKNKLVHKEFSLLGNYIFFHHNDLKNENIINSLRSIKGLKYFLNGYSKSQKELSSFVSQCEKSEDKNGFINDNFVSLIYNNYYKFKTGPFVDKLFKLVNFNKEYLEILLGNIKTKIKTNSYLIEPV